MKTIPLLNYKKLPVEDLIASFADKSQDKSILDHSFREFHSRFIQYIYSVCAKNAIAKSSLMQTEIETIVSNTLIKVYEHSGTFKPAPEGLSEKQKVKRVNGWLAAIARHETIKCTKEVMQYEVKLIRYDDKEELVEKINIISNIIEEDIPPPTPHQLLLEKAWAEISERDQEITSAYLTHEDENGRIDKSILERILLKYNLLPKYPAKIKNRTIDKLKSLINPILEKTNNYGFKTEKRGKNHRGGDKEVPPRYRKNVPGNTGTG